jgi:hypothetical protein
VDWSRAARSRGLEVEVTVKTLKHGSCQCGIGVTRRLQAKCLKPLTTTPYFRRDFT